MTLPRLVFSLLLLMSSLVAQSRNPRQPSDLAAPAREVFDYAIGAADRAWDAQAGLLRSKVPALGEESGLRHGVRDTAMYASALLFRDGPGDRQRAAQAIEAVLAQQLREPGKPYHGTFLRAPEEPRPGAGAAIWKDYDPNWRQFIGCCWVIILQRDAAKLSPELRARLLDSLQLAIDGEIGEKRLRPSYSNIALMHAFVALETGLLSGRKDLVSEGEHYTRAVHAEYLGTGSFAEFNSPTYYGVDLFALALWRSLGGNDEMRHFGAALEQGLWRDIADFYHAGLRNLCGPFDRTYGMDMNSYLSLTGLLLRLELGAGQAPLPPLSEHMAHGNDLSAGMLYPQVPAMIPPETLARFRCFEAPRSVQRTLSEGRRATAWLGNTLMIGAEGGGHLKSVDGPRSQYRPASIHWLMPSGEIGWLTLVEGSHVDASASPKTLRISLKRGAVFILHCGNHASPQLSRDHWLAPGLKLKVQTDGHAFAVKFDPEQQELRYDDASLVVLEVE